MPSLPRRRFLELALAGVAAPAALLAAPAPTGTPARAATKRPDRSPVQGIKIVVVGDPGVGKSSLLVRYVTGRFPTGPVATGLEPYRTRTEVHGLPFDLQLWDTEGGEDYARLRPLAYPQAHCFVLLYSVGDRDSFDRVLSSWVPELKNCTPNARILLVAAKIDLRLRAARVPLVGTAQGADLARRIGAVAFLECSARAGTGVDQVFATAVGRT